MNPITTQIKEALQMLAVPEKAAVLASFFKTGKGGYGEGDVFIGVSVPDQRKVAKAFYLSADTNALGELLYSKIHEHRLTALLILVLQFEKSKNPENQKQIIDFYLAHLPYINNWDLVDTACYKILGRYAFEQNRDDLLNAPAASENMWHKRIAVVGTMHHVKKDRYDLTLSLILKNLQHPHDLMHKANGWLLREVGNRNLDVLTAFLDEYYRKMPRTTLRYAIEKLPENTRQDYLKSRI